MNKTKLKQAEKKFLEIYPGGFDHPYMQEIAKKHKMEKMINFAKESFAKDKFDNDQELVNNMATLVGRSSMVSVFEKPKFKDFVKSLNDSQKKGLASSLKELLYGDEKKGFEALVDILQVNNLAKWTLVTVYTAYFNPENDVFIKPTTTKNVIQYFELEGLEYKPRPGYEFYVRYREAINKMKKEVDKSFSSSNAAFSGFLMMSMS